MSEKVVITKEQAEAIENLEPETPKSSIVKAHLNHKGMWGSDMSPLNALHADKLIQALYIGYEVEPEFNENDWIYQNGKIDRIIWVNHKKNLACLDCAGIIGITNIDRHATPEEIAAEKERRWWNKHGRDVWELRTGDVISDEEGDFREVSSDRNPGDDGVALMDGGFNQKYLETFCKVVCFKENRMDVSE